MKAFCPATMCPVMAPNGSIWTGQTNALCEKEECGFFHKGHCEGQGAAYEQVAEVEEKGFTLHLNPEGDKFHKRKPMAYACPRAAECQWQREAGDKLCPPRFALSQGIDPRVCLY